MPDAIFGLNARPMPAGVLRERGATAATLAEETVRSLREMLSDEETLDGGRPIYSTFDAAWVLHRRGVLRGLSAEARALASTPWTGTLEALLDKTEDIRRRVPPRTAPDDFDDPELKAIRLHRAAVYRAASVWTRQNLAAALAEAAHPTIRRAKNRIEDLLRYAREGMRRARTEQDRRTATAEIHRFQMALAEIADAEQAPPEDPAATAKQILAKAEGR